jgi:hypothetical protein
MFVDETKMLLANHPNVYATMEASLLFCILNPAEQVRLLAEFIGSAGPHKVIFASAATNPHPQRVLDALSGFEMPEGFPIQLTDEVRAMIMGGNHARLHGLDIEERRQRIANDRFSQERAANGLRPMWSTLRGQA